MTETLVDRRRRIMRDELGRIAIELFVERGFDAVTVDDIAEAAGASQRTFFRYFATKDEIVFDLSRRLRQRLLDALDARPATEGPVTALRNAYCTTSHVGLADRQRVIQLAKVLTDAPALRDRAHGEHVGVSGELVKRLAARIGVSAGNARLRVLVTAASAVATVEFYRWADGGGSGEPSKAIADSLSLLEVGFADLD